MLNIRCIAIVLKTVFICTFWRVKTLLLWKKIIQNLPIFVYLFCPKKSTTGSRKTSKTQKWLVVETCLIPRWIAFLMPYRLVYNIRFHFNELILAWSTHHKENILSFCRTHGWQIWSQNQIPHNFLPTVEHLNLRKNHKNLDLKQKPFSSAPGLNRVNSLN